MKIKNLFCTLLSAVVLLAGATSCNDDSPTTLQLEVKTLYAKADEDVSIWVRGNGGYELEVSNESVLTAAVENNYSYITLHPLTKGTTTLTVTDSDNQTATATIHIKDPYMAFGVISVTPELKVTDNDKIKDLREKIQKDLDDNYTIRKDYLYDLTKNEKLGFAEYKGYWETSAGSGTYSFSEDAMNMTFKISDKESTFGIKNDTYGKMFYDYFVSDKLPGVISENVIHLNLTEDMTEEYKKKYPDAGITSVEVVSVTQIFRYRAEY